MATATPTRPLVTPIGLLLPAPIPARPTPPPAPRRRLAPTAPVAALVGVGLLAVSHVDQDAMAGLGLAGVLPVTAWAGIVLVALAAGVELLGPARPRVLAALTAGLALVTSGVASVVEPGARMAVAWLHLGFIQAIAADGRVPTGVDSRFSWAGFFSQWAFLSDAAGAGTTDLDAVLRWTPPVVALVWSLAVLVLARRLLGGTRAPWAAAWLFLGLNWIEQDYFSPQATAMLLVGVVWVLVLGPLATRRVPGSRWRVRHPRTTDPGVVVSAWALIALCLAALAVSHQLTPFALFVQLAVLVAAGRVYGGRGLLVFLVVAVAAWVVLGGREFWLNQLALATGGVGDAGGSMAVALADRLVGDLGQLGVKIARVALAGAAVALAGVGALLLRRRTGALVWLPVALAPAGLVLVQSYGGEVLLRVLLYGAPFLAVLGTEALRAAYRRRRSVTGVVLVAGLALLACACVTVRGGNDAYTALRPSEIAFTRAVLDGAPAGSTVLPLSSTAPTQVARVGTVTQTPRVCDQISDDPVRCALVEDPAAIFSLPTMDAEGVVLDGRSPGWSRQALAAIVATGHYRVAVDDGLAVLLVRTS
ncbi:hypothetical protein [Actinomycetospora sp. NBRC 106378]|uniref:hypothetical protein n=1 Tax=Actinomycetospora sp. NBRC 106378 TaxID=3032208 RepID=UPI0024A16784|nr:hypothetical protein [Actinomycetospora sp. NBRC 106378]GLZ50614.1 hypothetical protein Acsp07_02310 [Actinomycetospora sp. NBRC 106378]